MSRQHRLEHAAEWLGARAEAVIVGLGLVMLVAYLTAMSVSARPGGRVVVGDATHHFVQLRSVVFDRDLHFQNEYVRLYGLKGGEPDTEWIVSELTSTAHVRNYMPVGPAVLWAPLYALAAACQWMLALAGVAPRPDGYDWVLQLSAGITGILAATAAAWISWRLAARYTTRAAALLAVAGVWAGSHALYYSLVSPAYSHAPSMFTAAAFFSYWLATRDDPTFGRAAVWGALAGAAALMRWQDALFVVVPLIDIARWRRPWHTRLSAAAVAVLAALIVFLPQMFVWRVLYGQALALPQGPSFMQWSRPHLIAVLISDNHGLFTWAPLLLVCVIGLAAFVRRRRDLALPIVVILAASWYVNASVADWWAGEAFGARRFLSLFPLFVIGLAVWLCGSAESRVVRPGRVAVLSALAGANLLLLLQYQLAMKGLETIAPYPHGWFDMWVARFLVPIRLLTWWAS